MCTRTIGKVQVVDCELGFQNHSWNRYFIEVSREEYLSEEVSLLSDVLFIRMLLHYSLLLCCRCANYLAVLIILNLVFVPYLIELGEAADLKMLLFAKFCVILDAFLLLPWTPMPSAKGTSAL